MRGKNKYGLVFIAILAILAGFVLFHPSKTDAAINPQINFQGKLANPDGTNVTDGTYSIVFSIYSVSSGGSAVWTETQSSVTVASGIFQVSLGSVTALPGSVDFNSASLYLGVKVGSDAEMTPRIQLTAAPYAFNASQVGGLSAASLVQLSPGSQQTGNVNVSGSLTAAGGLNINSGATVPTTDQVVIDNTSSTGVTTAGVNGLNLHYKGGAAAVEGAGFRVDYTPGTTSGGTWSGLRVIEGAASASGVASYGLKLEGGGAGSGTDTALYVNSNWDIGLDLQSGGIQMLAQSDPATPSGNNLRIYAKAIAGRVMPKWIGPAGVDTPFQASFGFNRIAMVTPSQGTTGPTIMTEWGGTFTNSATTYSTPALASTNLVNSVRRARIQTSATAGNIAYHEPTAGMAWRGNAAGLGGFFFTTRFSFGTSGAANRGFVGLVDNAGTAPTNVDPTTTTTPGKLGVAFNANTAMSWVNNVSGTAPTKVALATSAPTAANLYELVIYSPPNGSSIFYRVTNLTTNVVLVDSSTTTNIPANTTFLAPETWISNQGTGATAYAENAGWYLESDN